jgi:hypothetical protein
MTASAVVGIPPRTAVSRYRTSEAFHATSFLVLAWWPYAIAPPQLTLAVLVATSLVALLNRPMVLPQLAGVMVAFILYSLSVIALHVLGGGTDAFSLSQFNHLIQFALYYVAFAKIVQRCDWLAIVASTRFLVVTALLWLLYSFISGPLGFAHSDLGMTLMMLLVGLFVRGEQQHRLMTFLVILAVGVALLLVTQRLTVLLLSAVLLTIYWMPLRPWMTATMVAIVLFTPIIFYLGIDNTTVKWLYQLDHNTSIRAEFIRGGANLLAQSPLVGIGFGEPYRPTAFPYMHRHPLLNDAIAVSTVPNHHSLFDVALRLGIPAALGLAWGIFAASGKRERGSLVAMLSIVAAVGMSFNAWFENQYALPELVLVIALLASAKRGDWAKQSGHRVAWRQRFWLGNTAFERAMQRPEGTVASFWGPAHSPRSPGGQSPEGP